MSSLTLRTCGNQGDPRIGPLEAGTCEQALVFMCLPQSHPTLYEWVADFERNGAVKVLVVSRWTGRQRLTDTHRYLQRLPLRDSDDALLVDWCELTTTNATGRILYRNAWATSHTLDAKSLLATVAAGRSRWKIENENNNTLKTGGGQARRRGGGIRVARWSMNSSR